MTSRPISAEAQSRLRAAAVLSKAEITRERLRAAVDRALDQIRRRGRGAYAMNTRPRVLIVDDNDASRFAKVQTLTRAGIHVAEARDRR